MKDKIVALQEHMAKLKQIERQVLASPERRPWLNRPERRAGQKCAGGSGHNEKSWNSGTLAKTSALTKRERRLQRSPLLSLSGILCPGGLSPLNWRPPGLFA